MKKITKSLSFKLKLPNKKTLQALKELKNKKGKTFEGIEELFRDLDKRD